MKLWWPWACPAVRTEVTPGGDLRVTIGQSPIDGGIVVVDRVHGVVFGPGIVGDPVVELGPLGMDRNPSGEVAQSAA